MFAKENPRLFWAGAIAVVLGAAHLIAERPFPLYGWILIGFGVLAMLTWLLLSRRERVEGNLHSMPLRGSAIPRWVLIAVIVFGLLLSANGILNLIEGETRLGVVSLGWGVGFLLIAHDRFRRIV